MAQAYEQLGEYELALKALSRGGGVGGENSKVVSLRGYVLAKMGRENEAREVLKTLETMARERYMPPYAIAQVHAGLREVDAAFAWLERAVEDARCAPGDAAAGREVGCVARGCAICRGAATSADCRIGVLSYEFLWIAMGDRERLKDGSVKDTAVRGNEASLPMRRSHLTFGSLGSIGNEKRPECPELRFRLNSGPTCG